jgi:hypothetical protein
MLMYFIKLLNLLISMGLSGDLMHNKNMLEEANYLSVVGENKLMAKFCFLR